MPLVLRLERKVRRSPAEATAVCKPQVVQNASLPTDKKGGGSLAPKRAWRICWDQHRCMPERAPPKPTKRETSQREANQKRPT
jgi:hypothetical protein